MPNLNKVMLIGHLGKDPETRYMADGRAVTNLTLATSEKWKDKQTGEQKEATEWHRVTFYGKPAETIDKYCSKGSALYVEGKLQTRKWQDKEGNDRYTTEIVGREFQFVGGRSGESKPAAPAQSADDFDDSIPF